MPDHYSTDKIIAALKQVNGMVYLAARVLDCSPNTIYARAKRTQSIQDAIDNSRGELVDLAEQKFRAAILAGEPWAVAMALKTLGKSRGYVERQEVTGADGEPIKVKGYVAINPDDWEAKNPADSGI